MNDTTYLIKMNHMLWSNAMHESANHTHSFSDSVPCNATPVQAKKKPDPLAPYQYKQKNGHWYVTRNGFEVSLYSAWYVLDLANQYEEGSYIYKLFVDWSRADANACQRDFVNKTGYTWPGRGGNPDSLECSPVTQVSFNALKQKRKKTMSADYEVDREWGDDVAVSLAAKKTEFLRDELSEVYSSKTDELRKQYGLVDDDRPTTPEDLVKRIQDGKYILPSKDDKKKSYWYASPLELITWRDPAKEKDQAGFDKALEAFDKEHTAARRDVMILDPKDALATLKALEAWTPTGQAS